MLALDKPWDWLILAVLVFALFGYKKLPDAARSLGRSMRIFKTEIKGMRDDDKAREEADAEPKALPAADVIKREAQAEQPARERPRPSPSPQSRA